MKKHLLSKSSYIRGMQCLKSVYLYKYHYKERDPLSAERLIRFQKGHDIGLLAQDLFPGGIDASPSHVSKYHESVELTRQLVNKKQKVIYEAACIYNDVLAAVDILENDNGWTAYEVKSSEKISDTYLNDAALQFYVLNGCGLALKDFYIIHLAKHHNDITGVESLQELFQFTSVKQHCLTKTKEVAQQIEKIKYTLASSSVPVISMGNHCQNPYPCDFIGWCTRQEKEINEGLFGQLL